MHQFHKFIFTFMIFSTLTACANQPLEQKHLEEFDEKRMIERNTLNMSEFDKQKYYTDHNLGPVPAQKIPKAKQKHQ